MYVPIRQVIEVVIPNGEALSLVKDLAERTLLGIQMPAAWTAANLTFRASAKQEDDPVNVHDASGAEVTVTAAADRYIELSPDTFRGVRFLQVRSGTAATPVNQAAERTLLLVVQVVS